MKVLVITPNWNGGRFLADGFQRMVEACRAGQGCGVQVLWLIVDNCSTDTSIGRLRSLIGAAGHGWLREVCGLDVRVRQARDAGMYAALNAGLEWAEQLGFGCDLFFWLNSDDRVTPTLFRDLSGLALEPEAPAWWICRAIDLEADGTVSRDEEHPVLEPARLVAGDFNYPTGGWIRAESCLFNAALLQRLQRFRADLRLAGDHEFLLRAAQCCAPTYVTGFGAREFRRHEGQQSRDLLRYELERSTVVAALPRAAAAAATQSAAAAPEHGTIFFYPDYRQGNSYQTLLYAGCAAQGLATVADVEAALPQMQRGDVLHLHWLNQILRREPAAAEAEWARLQACLAAAQERGVLLVWTVHNISAHEGLNLELEHTITLALIHQCDRVHLHDQLALVAFQRRYGTLSWGRTRIVPHPAYPAAQQACTAELRLGFGVLPEEAYVVVPGQIRRYKNLPLLELALLHLAAVAPELPVLFPGRLHGELRPAELELLTRHGNSRFAAERLEDEAYGALVREARFALLAYTRISTSGSLVHAMSQGTAVVAPRLGSIPAICAGYGAAYLYDNADPLSLQRALDRALQGGSRGAELASGDWGVMLARLVG